MKAEDYKSSVKVLLNPDLIKKLNPWELKIYLLIELFKKYLEELGKTDFRLSGVAVLTSSIIYEMKVRKMFYEPKHREYKAVPLNESIIEESSQSLIPVEIPVSSVEELLEAFKELVKELTSGSGAMPKALEPSSLPVIAESLFVESLNEYKSYVMDVVKAKGKVSLYEILKGKDPLTAVRIFLSILILLTERSIEINDYLEIFPTHSPP